ncbi:hypothetical protein BGW80DRAFT_907268 [Lactifluus volemus]|nr:hypothetical protein BGW80DRAFT_907268 [Lactifluus volemus]
MSSTSTFSSSSSDGGVPTSAVPSSSSRSGTSSSATLLFSFLVVFVALFTAFLLLGFFWTVRRGRRQEMLLEFDEAKGAYKGVPEMWEVWIQDEPSGSQWEWEKIRPLSVDFDRAPILPVMSATPRPRSRSRLGLRNPFSTRRAPTSAQAPHNGTVLSHYRHHHLCLSMVSECRSSSRCLTPVYQVVADPRFPNCRARGRTGGRGSMRSGHIILLFGRRGERPNPHKTRYIVLIVIRTSLFSHVLSSEVVSLRLSLLWVYH